jgi:hypothetical protein
MQKDRQEPLPVPFQFAFRVVHVYFFYRSCSFAYEDPRDSGMFVWID